jgi:hypothetical protein
MDAKDLKTQISPKYYKILSLVCISPAGEGWKNVIEWFFVTKLKKSLLMEYFILYNIIYLTHHRGRISMILLLTATPNLN